MNKKFKIKKMMRYFNFTFKRGIILLTALSISMTILSQNELKINANTNYLNINKLNSGLKKYLVYTKLPNGNMAEISIWQRKVEITNNEVKISQTWENQDSKKMRTIFSICDKKTFIPKYHKTISGENIIEAYDFQMDKIVGSDSIPNNSKKDFNIKLDTNGIPFNWELDLEFFQILPLQLNSTFIVNFYHPGGKSNPKEYVYKVIREEQLETSYGSIDTWVLEIEYSIGNTAIFWIRKKDNITIKMKEQYGQISRIKQLL